MTHLCKTCAHEFATCPAEADDIVWGYQVGMKRPEDFDAVTSCSDYMYITIKQLIKTQGLGKKLFWRLFG